MRGGVAMRAVRDGGAHARRPGGGRPRRRRSPAGAISRCHELPPDKHLTPNGGNDYALTLAILVAGLFGTGPDRVALVREAADATA